MLLHVKSSVSAGFYVLTWYHLAFAFANENSIRRDKLSLRGSFGRFAPGFTAFERESLGFSKPSRLQSALPPAASSLATSTRNGLTNDEVEMLSVKFDSPALSLSPFNIVAQEPKFPGPTNLGGSTVSGSASEAAPGSRPVSSWRGSIQSQSQSAIWTIDKSNLELNAHWITHNGQSPPTYTILNRRSNTLYLTNDSVTTSLDMVFVILFLSSCEGAAPAK
ncbi:hypothetical protein Clacol_008949 [Clathrus columnatus]|uniref:Uncharacterized protein n=1 Tax=Clathrus columnatus TaxID=1419009 RepID=A0AAV5APR9_9AGAM|nr:hypothetical protein Clacol_008949 [Clathrus columnatus]